MIRSIVVFCDLCEREDRISESQYGNAYLELAGQGYTATVCSRCRLNLPRLLRYHPNFLAKLAARVSTPEEKEAWRGVREAKAQIVSAIQAL